MAPRDAFGNEIRKTEPQKAAGGASPTVAGMARPGRTRVVAGVIAVVVGINLVGLLVGLVGGEDATPETSSAPARPEATPPQRPVDADDLAAVQVPEGAMYAEPRFRRALAAIDGAALGEVFSIVARADGVTAIMVDDEGVSRFARVEVDAPEAVRQSEASAAYAGQDTVATDAIDVSAPERLARGYAASTGRDLAELSYLIFGTTDGNWNAYGTRENERRVRGDANGRLKRR